jgi:hypothetical protein
MQQLSDDQIALVSGGEAPDFSNVTTTVTSTEQFVNRPCSGLVMPFFSFGCRK